MKKSEMVSIIQKYLNSRISLVAMYEIDPIIGDMLSEMEDYGMLPPETSMEQDEDDIRRNGVSFSGYYTVNQWDEE